MNLERLTTVRLIQSPIEIDNDNQLTFSDKQAQLDYFLSLPYDEPLTNASYQRKDNIIRYPGNIEKLRKYNYVMYQNGNNSDKWYFAFVNGMEYASENLTIINIETDYFQTWQFDIVYKASFVERKHVTDDRIGANTLPEGLEIGEYIIRRSLPLNLNSNPTVYDHFEIVFQTTDMPTDTIESDLLSKNPQAKNRVYNGLPQGCYFFSVHSADSMAEVIKQFNQEGRGDSIVSIFMLPKSITISGEWVSYNLGGVYIYFPPNSTAESKIFDYEFEWKRDFISEVGGTYTPQNNKLYTYPYNYIFLSNNAGQSREYHVEEFMNQQVTLSCIASICQGANFKIYPTHYKYAISGGKPTQAYNYGLPANKMPQLSWQSDYYLNYQAMQGKYNEYQKTSGLIGAGIGIIGSLATKNIGGAVNSAMSGVDAIANSMQAVHVAETSPDEAKGNIETSDLNFSSKKYGFTIQQMSIRTQYAIQIDNYFSMYGYKVNSLEIPNINTRKYFNYIRTIKCNIAGDIPQDDLQALKGIFNKGCTFWHDPKVFLEYGIENPNA